MMMAGFPAARWSGQPRLIADIEAGEIDVVVRPTDARALRVPVALRV
jgi:hypothetical protein